MGCGPSPKNNEYQEGFMKLTFGGVRGTEPVPGSDYAFYGGNSTSMLIEADGDRALILDMGSGVTAFADSVPALLKNKAISLIMSHYHLDHVCGLPRFSPIYNAGIELDCYGPMLHGQTCEEVLHTLMSKPLWPIPLYSLGEKNRFHTLESGENFEGQMIAGFRVRWCTLHHFEGCMAYRIEDPTSDRSVVIATDVECQELGRVVDLLAIKPGEQLVVRGAGGKEILVPFVKEIVQQVDLEKRVVLLKLPDGLRDL